MAQVSSEIARLIAEAALVKKATDIVVLDLRELSEITDFFVICSGDSDVQVRAIADQISESLSKVGVTEWHVEGYLHGRWILIDYVEVVVHVFLQEVRDYYGLEDLWGDAPSERMRDEHTQGQGTVD